MCTRGCLNTTVVVKCKRGVVLTHFRRTLVGSRWEAWLNIVRRLMDVQLSQQTDQLCWKLTENGEFLVKSMYLDVINSSAIPRSKHVWKVKISLKIKVFMWFVYK